ncbi:STAS domain-containing protein [Kitasatospora purpeofusca]|uniref:STAS domain-containing protein n=1 Tax=Kitasatospora purpeofusca TaxID=67352 RepID=UPI00365D89C4|nr:STAS domain-containing protein [Kitasatospora purpeofusca]
MMPSDNDPGYSTLAAVPPYRPGLVVETRSGPGGAKLCVLVGDLDIETLAPAAEALDALVAQGPGAVVIDLGGVGFCDSSGLNVLLRTRIAAERGGLELRLAAVPPTVMRVFDLTGARAVFSIHDSVAGALAG